MSVKDSIARPIKHSLDDMPSLTRQLAEMMRRHRQKQDANRNGVTDLDKFDDRTQLDVSMTPFNRNPGHNEYEFNRQRDEQLNELQNISIKDWLDRADNYKPKRTPESIAAQQVARDKAFNEMRAALLDEGVDLEIADKAARDWLATQHATHRLDGVAGGDVADVPHVGDANVNMSLGSQWKPRVTEIKQQVDAFIAANPGVDLSNVFLNIG